MTIRFKNALMLIFMLAFVVVLAACNGTEDNTSTQKSTTEKTATTKPAETTESSETTEEPIDSPYDFNDMEIIIMVNNPSEVDPRLSSYSGNYQEEKLERLQYVEKYYKVKIVYRKWPETYAWGPARYTGIITDVANGNPIGHIYQVPNTWIPQLVTGNAIVPVDDYISKYTERKYFDDRLYDFGFYQGKHYAFDSGLILYTEGLFYNLDLLKELQLESPAKLWNEGKWDWDTLVQYAERVANLKGQEGYKAIGGQYSVWAKHMIPANSGYLVNPLTGNVAFTTADAIGALNFLHNRLYNPGYWENSPAYDAGSDEWQQGKVLFYPGDIWFLRDTMRWKDQLDFEIGYVPFPKGDSVSDNKPYRVGSSEETIFVLSAGFEEEDNKGITSEMIFKIWSDLQVWKDSDTLLDDFVFDLELIYDDPHSIEAHRSVANEVYPEYIFQAGIGAYETGRGYHPIMTTAITGGDPQATLEQYVQMYQDGIDEFLGKK